MQAPPRHLTIALVLGAATVAVAWTGVAERMWRWVGAPLLPWQRALSAREEPPADALLTQLNERLIRLNAENVILRRRLAEYQEIVGEGRVPPAQAVVARGQIVARTLRQGRRYCELDVGAVDGVEIEMAATLGWSLVGMVVGRGPGRCLVREITDSESRIPAALYDENELLAEGVLRGTGAADTALLEFVEDRPGLEVAPGQRVVTVGLDRGAPGGLALGSVVGAERAGPTDHWRITVKPLRSAATSDSLLVLRLADPPPLPAPATPEKTAKPVQAEKPEKPEKAEKPKPARPP
jgi:cell shape-determining protein MreC